MPRYSDQEIKQIIDYALETSQSDAAEEFGVAKSTISHWIKGQDNLTDEVTRQAGTLEVLNASKQKELTQKHIQLVERVQDLAGAAIDLTETCLSRAKSEDKSLDVLNLAKAADMMLGRLGNIIAHMERPALQPMQAPPTSDWRQNIDDDAPTELPIYEAKLIRP